MSNEDERHPLRRKMIDLLAQNHVTKRWLAQIYFQSQFIFYYMIRLIIVNRDDFIQIHIQFQNHVNNVKMIIILMSS